MSIITTGLNSQYINLSTSFCHNNLIHDVNGHQQVQWTFNHSVIKHEISYVEMTLSYGRWVSDHYNRASLLQQYLADPFLCSNTCNIDIIEKTDRDRALNFY